MDTKIIRFLKRKQVVAVLGSDYLLSERQHMRLARFFAVYGHEKRCEEWFRTVSLMLLHDLSNIVGRIRRLKLLSASPTRYSLMLRYGCNWEDYSKVAASRRTAHFKNKLQYWIDNGYSAEDAKLKVVETQTARSRKSPAAQGGSSEFSCRSSIFWVKRGLTLEQAQVEVARVQRRTKTPEMVATWLATLSAKSPEEQALIRLKKGHSIDSYIACGSTSTEAIELSKAYYAKRNNASKSSQAFFMLFDTMFDHSNTWYKYKNYEKQFFGKCVDFYDADSETVVEYYGDFWHRNPKKYAADFLAYNKTSEEIWDLDSKRIAQIKQHHLVQRVIVIWESEVMQNPHAAAEAILQEIKNGN